jgi:hypothetical protein
MSLEYTRNTITWVHTDSAPLPPQDYIAITTRTFKIGPDATVTVHTCIRADGKVDTREVRHNGDSEQNLERLWVNLDFEEDDEPHCYHTRSNH